MDTLIHDMNDATIGNWDDPLMVKRKLEHPGEEDRAGRRKEDRAGGRG